MPEIEKRVARDGTQRGLHSKGKKHRRTELLEAIREAVERDTGLRDWDPVVQMSVIAARAFMGYPATDEDGRPILDQNGKQVIIPPDFALATAAAAKVAPYLHQQLRPKDADSEEDADGPVDARTRAIEMARALGLPTARLEHHDADDV